MDLVNEIQPPLPRDLPFASTEARSEQGAQLEVGEAPRVMESRPEDLGIPPRSQDQIRSEQGVQLGGKD